MGNYDITDMEALAVLKAHIAFEREGGVRHNEWFAGIDADEMNLEHTDADVKGWWP